MRSTITAALLFAAVAAPLGAQQTVRVAVAPSSTVSVSGTSNVHAWTLTSTSFEASIELPAGKPAEIGGSVKAVVVTVPVTTLKSGKGGMDKNAYKALNAELHANITYRLTSYSATPQGGAFAGVAKGQLTVNGVEKPVELAVTVTPDGRGGARAVGTTSFKQTAFGVKPVTAMMGAIKCGDDVTVKFELAGTTAQMLSALPVR